MKRVMFPALAAVLALGAFATDAAAQKKKASVKIVNNSDYDIHHLYMAESASDDWGPDQLGENVIQKKGGSFTLNQIPCSTYDVQLVDEDGDRCEVEKIDVCAKNETWTIGNKDLLSCQGWGQ